MSLSDEQLDRYARHIILKEVGGEGQRRLLDAKVAVIGAGGLGSPLILYLAAAGVGTIGVIDDDVVELSNLQRQVLHTNTQLGALKTASATEAVSALNPDVKVTGYPMRLSRDNARDILSGYDVVADGCDNFTTRLTVNDACVALGIPLVSAAVAGFEGQISTFKPHAGPDLPCYRCFVPDDPGDLDRSCSDQGILGAVAGVLGTLQGVEVLKEILGIGDSLAGRLLIYDALGAQMRTIRLPRDPACPVCGGAK